MAYSYLNLVKNKFPYLRIEDEWKIIRHWKPEIGNKDLMKMSISQLDRLFLSEVNEQRAIQLFRRYPYVFGCTIDEIQDMFGMPQLNEGILMRLVKIGKLNIAATTRRNGKFLLLYDPVELGQLTYGDLEPPQLKKILALVYDESDLTDRHLAEALYVINKAAKQYRDKKNKFFNDGAHVAAQEAKTNEKQLYDMKRLVLEELEALGRAKIIGYHVQQFVTDERDVVYYDCFGSEITEEDYAELYDSAKFTQKVVGLGQKLKDYTGEPYYKIVNRTVERKIFLLLYELAGFEFHLPSERQPENANLIGEIGTIPAEVTIETGLSRQEAIEILTEFQLYSFVIRDNTAGNKRRDKATDHFFPKNFRTTM